MVRRKGRYGELQNHKGELFWVRGEINWPKAE